MNATPALICCGTAPLAEGRGMCLRQQHQTPAVNQAITCATKVVTSVTQAVTCVSEVIPSARKAVTFVTKAIPSAREAIPCVREVVTCLAKAITFAMKAVTCVREVVTSPTKAVTCSMEPEPAWRPAMAAEPVVENDIPCRSVVRSPERLPTVPVMTDPLNNPTTETQKQPWQRHL